MSQPVNILVVDDHRENLLALEETLANQDYSIVTADSGSEALKQILKHEFAVVLMDVVMPGMDGFEAARLIRQRQACRELPIVFLTATGADAEFVAQGYSVGAVDYLIKPVNPAIVKAKVAVFVDLFRKTQRIREQEERLRRAERLRSEHALKESEALYQATFDEAAVGIGHAATDGRWLRVNERFCEILGYTEEELLSLRAQDLTHDEDAAATVAAMHQMLMGEIASAELDKRYLHKSGLSVWCRLTMSLLRDSRGKPKQFINVVEDVSKRKLDDLRQRFLAAASACLLSSLDPDVTLADVARLAVDDCADGCVVHVCEESGSRELALGYKNCEPAAIRASIGRLDDSGRGIGKVLATGSSEITQHAGDDGFSSVMIVPMCAQGQVLGAFSFVAKRPARDFTEADAAAARDLCQRAAFAIEHARLYQAAQEAVSARDEFLSIASHELRTPLTPLYIVFQRLLDSGGTDPLPKVDPERVRGMLVRSQRQVQRLTALVDNLLDVSRITSGRMRIQPEPAELGDVVRDVINRFSDELNRADCLVTLTVDGEVNGSWDRLRLEQVITNLLSNAVKYGAGKPIEIALAQNDERAQLAVRDYGIGIAPEQIPRIFERFERAVSSRSYGGLGLGLYIARQIVEAHGGTIRAESELGSGARFTVELPLTSVARTSEPAGAEDLKESSTRLRNPGQQTTGYRLQEEEAPNAGIPS